VRGILIVNPHATTTEDNTPDQVIRSLAGLVDLDVEHTRHRGHARELAEAADGDLVLVLGGDGAVNEAVNGVIARAGSASSQPPLIGVIPGGGGNVLAQALGLPVDTEAAIARVKDALAAGRYRTLGLGLAADRYFTFSAGLGLDAEVVHEVDQLREAGRRESASLYLRAMVRRYYRDTDRRAPALTLERDGQPTTADLFMAIVTNSSPWTYFRGRPLLAAPDPDFNSGLDLLVLRRLRLSTIGSVLGQMLWVRSRPPRGRHVLSVRGADAFTLRALRPIAFQVDGEYLGETKAVEFRFVPRAIRVVA
jgi:diacylglycerol kinase family enzyme